MSDAVQLQVVPLPDKSCNKPTRRLAQWSLRLSPLPDDHGAIVLTGRVFGHPEFADDTEIVTSPPWLIVRTETADLAYTNTAVYELSAAHPDLTLRSSSRIESACSLLLRSVLSRPLRLT